MRHIAFGYQPDWAVRIIANLDRARFRPAFAALDRIDLDRFDAVLPLDQTHYAELAHRPDLRGRAFVHPAPAIVALCDDKPSLARALIDGGFGAHVPALLDTPRYPLIRRPRVGGFGRDTYLLRGPADDRALRAFPARSFDQAFVPGVAEYALHILRVRGTLRYAHAIRYDMPDAWSIRSEACPPRHSLPVDPAPGLAVVLPMLEMLGYEGTACANYKLADGRLMLLEINPRFGGSLVGDVTRYAEAYCAALGR